MDKTPTEVFMQSVLDRLASDLEKVDQETRNIICEQMPGFYNDGWTVADTVRFHRLTEEINPELSEDYALRKMAEIRSKYE